MIKRAPVKAQTTENHVEESAIFYQSFRRLPTRSPATSTGVSSDLTIKQAPVKAQTIENHVEENMILLVSCINVRTVRQNLCSVESVKLFQMKPGHQNVALWISADTVYGTLRFLKQKYDS